MPPSGMTDYTYAFGDNGTILNTDALSYPFVDVTQVTGLDSAPQRSTTDEHQGMDGTYVDNPFMSMRTIVVTGTLYTLNSDPETLLTSLRSDYQSPVVTPFYFQHPGQPLKFLNCKGGGLQYDVDTGRRTGKTAVQFTALAGDPYIYDYPGQVANIAIPTLVNLGASFNMAFNVGFGGPLPNYGATVVNGGTHSAYPVITLTGPLVDPILVDSVYGITMMFNITLAAGDYLVIDCKNKSVVLNGQVSRRSTLAGLKWFSVPPKTQSTIAFAASSGTGSASITMYSTYY